MIKLRMDVDYPYPSRLKSFLFTILNRKTKSNYLKNAKIIAKMLNESPRETMTYWFFTPITMADQEMLALMQKDKHEAALHVATDPYKELAQLEKVTQQRVRYYTIHGTERLFARLMWRRKISQSRVPIPKGFPLQNFWDFPTLSLDRVCYANTTEKALRVAEQSIARGEILHFHPEWLFHRGILNRRGPYYEVLKRLLETDKDLDGLFVRKKTFARLAGYFDIEEYSRDFVPTIYFLKKLTERGIDVFTFLERRCCFRLPNPAGNWAKAKECVGLLHLDTYEKWWDTVGKKTRNMVRKSEKSGIVAKVVEPSETLAEGIWKIYNETPIRQGRGFWRYGQPLESVKNGVLQARNTTFVGAFLRGELVGFIQLVYGDSIAIIAQILSLQEHADKAVNNTLVAKAVETCAEKQVKWVMYGRMGNHPSLDAFKESNDFKKFVFTRYYVPLTGRGLIAIKLGLHQELKDILPAWLKQPLFPMFNWASRTKTRVRLALRS